jgi:hypothetical protein
MHGRQHLAKPTPAFQLAIHDVEKEPTAHAPHKATAAAHAVRKARMLLCLPRIHGPLPPGPPAPLHPFPAPRPLTILTGEAPEAVAAAHAKVQFSVGVVIHPAYASCCSPLLALCEAYVIVWSRPGHRMPLASDHPPGAAVATAALHRAQDSWVGRCSVVQCCASEQTSGVQGDVRHA